MATGVPKHYRSEQRFHWWSQEVGSNDHPSGVKMAVFRGFVTVRAEGR
jgi:hypothetical protein